LEVAVAVAESLEEAVRAMVAAAVDSETAVEVEAEAAAVRAVRMAAAEASSGKAERVAAAQGAVEKAAVARVATWAADVAEAVEGVRAWEGSRVAIRNPVRRRSPRRRSMASLAQR
jgi:hypothetical protein